MSYYVLFQCARQSSLNVKLTGCARSASSIFSGRRWAEARRGACALGRWASRPRWELCLMASRNKKSTSAGLMSPMLPRAEAGLGPSLFLMLSSLSFASQREGASCPRLLLFSPSFIAASHPHPSRRLHPVVLLLDIISCHPCRRYPVLWPLKEPPSRDWTFRRNRLQVWLPIKWSELGTMVAMDRTPIILCTLLSFADLRVASSGAWLARSHWFKMRLHSLNSYVVSHEHWHIWDTSLFSFDCQLFDVGIKFYGMSLCVPLQLLILSCRSL